MDITFKSVLTQNPQIGVLTFFVFKSVDVILWVSSVEHPADNKQEKPDHKKKQDGLSYDGDNGEEIVLAVDKVLEFL